MRCSIWFVFGDAKNCCFMITSGCINNCKALKYLELVIVHNARTAYFCVKIYVKTARSYFFGRNASLPQFHGATRKFVSRLRTYYCAYEAAQKLGIFAHHVCCACLTQSHANNLRDWAWVSENLCTIRFWPMFSCITGSKRTMFCSLNFGSAVPQQFH